MPTGYVLYNPKAGNDKTQDAVKGLQFRIQDPLKFADITKICDYHSFLTNGLEPDDYIILAGGDGTLNHFINNIEGIPFHNKILYFPIGTGNDFARELGKAYGEPPFDIGKYLTNLPVVEVQGQSRHFLNGIGFGIDGYCTEEGDRLRQQGKKKINYTLIAIQGLLWGFPPVHAKVTVDGKIYNYDRVYIAPTMFGKCYGGGMYPTPNQDRTKEDQTLSVMVFHSAGKMKTLMIFPSIFQGKHIKYTEAVTILEGKDIQVEFDRRSPLQIDGETISGVRCYHAMVAPIAAKQKSREAVKS